nr:MAG TPA: hypothetical protein [Bacteriophage sp.]
MPNFRHFFSFEHLAQCRCNRLDLRVRYRPVLGPNLTPFNALFS